MALLTYKDYPSADETMHLSHDEYAEIGFNIVTMLLATRSVAP